MSENQEKIATGTRVRYHGSAAPHGDYVIRGYSDLSARADLPPEAIETGYPGGVAYELWPPGVSVKFGNRDQAIYFVRRASFDVLDDEPRHPDVTVHLSTGHDGNIFAVIGTVTGALKRAGHGQDVKEFTEDVFGAQNYPDALNRIIGWVTVT
jgi:hypothetical protein